MGLHSNNFKLLSSISCNYYGLEEILTYGAFSYPITFLITDLANRAYGKKFCKKNSLYWFLLAFLYFTLVIQQIF